MGRELRRTPIGFGWPLNETWKGYLTPEWLVPPHCGDCEGSGNSPRYLELEALWYGNDSGFSPEDTGSTCHGPKHPTIMAMATRNVGGNPSYYGTGREAIDREAQRLANHFDSQWSHHLSGEDVAALIATGRDYGFNTRTPTAREFNDAALGNHMALDSSASWVCIEARLARENEPVECATCRGEGNAETWAGQGEAYESFEGFEPPTGDGWQMWETTSEGSPITPSFATRDELLDYLTAENVSYFGASSASREGWATVIDGCMASVEIAPGVIVI